MKNFSFFVYKLKKAKKWYKFFIRKYSRLFPQNWNQHIFPLLILIFVGIMLISEIMKSDPDEQRVAIIVPFRDRSKQLPIFIEHMQRFLNHQKITYKIYVVEQIQRYLFNKGRVMNAGFMEAIKDGNWNCFFFHDVDMLPQNNLNIYNCRSRPIHFTSAIDKYNYTVPYYDYFGGVIGMLKDTFEKINGFSNEFWGWGGEDDEVRARALAAGYTVSRLPKNIGKYNMIRHLQDIRNPTNECRWRLLKLTKERFRQEGLNTIHYKIIKKENKHFYTHFLVDVLENDARMKTNYTCLFSS